MNAQQVLQMCKYLEALDRAGFKTRVNWGGLDLPGQAELFTFGWVDVERAGHFRRVPFLLNDPAFDWAVLEDAIRPSLERWISAAGKWPEFEQASVHYREPRANGAYFATWRYNGKRPDFLKVLEAAVQVMVKPDSGAQRKALVQQTSFMNIGGEEM